MFNRLTRFAAALAAVVNFLPAGVQAQEYPSRNITFVCAFPPGSGGDVFVRFFAERARSVINQNILVENKPGATGNVAAEYVARARPDGYTIFVSSASSTAGNMHLIKNPPVDVGKDLQVVATINRQPYMLVIDAKREWKTLADLTAAMKSKQGNVTYGYSGASGQVIGELYRRAVGLNAEQARYRDGPNSLADQLNGLVDYGFHDPVYALAEMRSGRLRILAITTGTRMDAIPELPTFTEQGVPMDFIGWWAAMIPAGTPQPIQNTIHEWFVKIVSDPETKAFLNRFGGDPMIETIEQGHARLLADIKNWGEYVRIAKIEPQ